jgi:hypothetical protein
MPLSPAEQFASAAMTFEGVVERVSDRWTFLRRMKMYLLALVNRSPGYDQYDFGFEITFRVGRMWRGPGSRTVKILTGRGGGDCGYRFERGKRYLVYAYKDTGEAWGTGICTRTRAIEHAGEDLAYLKNVRLVPSRD